VNTPVTDQAFASVLNDDDEDLADLVELRMELALQIGFMFGSHVVQQ
jgi:hypothetical protein